MREKIEEILKHVHCGQCEAYANEDMCQGVVNDDKDWNGEPVKKLLALFEEVIGKDWKLDYKKDNTEHLKAGEIVNGLHAEQRKRAGL